MGTSIQEAFKQDTQSTQASLPLFSSTLIGTTSPEKFLEDDRKRFGEFEVELNSMRVEMAEVPSTESLVRLYSIQAKGRAYYERSEEIYRQYLKYLSTVSLLAKKAQFAMDEQYQIASIWVRQNKAEEYKATKSGDERTAIINSYIPKNLKEEKFQWDTLEAQAKTNFTILKSYRDQFKSINDNVLIQISILKNLIMLGELKVSPEILRAMRIVESSFRPTSTDMKERQENDAPIPELNIDEGSVII